MSSHSITWLISVQVAYPKCPTVYIRSNYRNPKSHISGLMIVMIWRCFQTVSSPLWESNYQSNDVLFILYCFNTHFLLWCHDMRCWTGINRRQWRKKRACFYFAVILPALSAFYRVQPVQMDFIGSIYWPGLAITVQSIWNTKVNIDLGQ